MNNNMTTGSGASMPKIDEAPDAARTQGLKDNNKRGDFLTQAVQVKQALMRFLAADRTFFCGVVLLNLLSGAHAAAAVIALLWLATEVCK